MMNALVFRFFAYLDGSICSPTEELVWPVDANHDDLDRDIDLKSVLFIYYNLA